MTTQSLPATQTFPTDMPDDGSHRPDAPAARRRIPYWVCVPIAMVMMFANYVGYLLLGLVLNLLKYQPGWTASTWIGLIGGFIIFATALLFTWLLAKHVLRTNLRGIGWTWSRDSWWLFLVGWAGAALATIVGTLLARGMRPQEIVEVRNGIDGAPLGAVLLGIAAGVVAGVIMQGIPEELLFRGWLMHCLQERPRLSLALSVISFGAMHIFSQGGQQNLAERLLYVVQAMAFAFLAGALALRLHSLWAAIGVHAGLHLTNLVLGMTPLATSGPVTWAGEIVVYVALALIVLATWKGTRVVMDR